MCVAHPEAFKSQTGALLDLNISSFQTLRVVNYRLEKVTQRGNDDCAWAVIAAATIVFICTR